MATNKVRSTNNKTQPNTTNEPTNILLRAYIILNSAGEYSIAGWSNADGPDVIDLAADYIDNNFSETDGFWITIEMPRPLTTPLPRYALKVT